MALEGWYEPLFTNRHHVPATLVESFVVDLVALASTYARRLGEQYPLAVRLDLVRSDSSKPVVLIGRERYGSSVAEDVGQMRGTRTVRKFVPIVTELPAQAGPDNLREVARFLAEDVLHQFGMASLSLLTPRK